ncbi:MAG: bifunctional phosphoribosylaminoimidazolecarboxamide formyltransferase/IMP cyclohydrolase [Candidatus Omnitrophota bacterium]
MVKIKRALISVSDKNGIVEFAKELNAQGIEIISTGGTAKILKENNIPAVEISDYTGFPEMLDGRVKTLHPKIHAGLLALRDNENHLEQLKRQNIGFIDMVVINLYPFEQTVKKSNVSLEEAIENIDIGGPSMLRSAAKNYKGVAVISDTKDYSKIIQELKETNGSISSKTLEILGKKVFRLTSSYDQAIYNYLEKKPFVGKELTDTLNLSYQKVQDLRYGENPHQKAAFYASNINFGFAKYRQLHGKELSFNNILDLEAAYKIVVEFNEPAAAIVKHMNPCGVSCNNNLKNAFVSAWNCDSLSAFGGIIGLNKEVDAYTAKAIVKAGFLECVIAPKFGHKALSFLTQKKNLRLIELGVDFKINNEFDFKKVEGGILLQDKDISVFDPTTIKTVTKRKPTKLELKALVFAAKVAKHVRSNAIVIAKGTRTLGIGAGLTSRVDSVWLALKKALKKDLKNSVLASDAFFPKEDGVRLAIKNGVKAIIQPGGSIQDEAIIKLCDKFNIAMVFTGIRHFKH